MAAEQHTLLVIHLSSSHKASQVEGVHGWRQPHSNRRTTRPWQRTFSHVCSCQRIRKLT